MTRTVGVALVALLLSGCVPAYQWTGIHLLYHGAPEPERVVRDLPYLPGSENAKHRMDLFLADGSDWPVLVFVHGGGWTAGDKGLTISGADVYGNIGRFYAERGIGTAVVNYRLQPEATWRQQVEDVAHALAWVRSNISEYGGDPSTVFLSGHSAGAYLSAFTALASDTLAEVGLEPGAVCGVIGVSGVAYDLGDEETFELGAKRPYYEARFRNGDPGRTWAGVASPITYVSSDDPPFLFIHGSREHRALAHQNRLLHEALVAAGVPSELRVAKQNHQSIVLALSAEKKLPASSVLEFVRGSGCGS